MAEFDVSGFLASFFDEARERLLKVSQKLEQLDAATAGDQEITQLRRELHTIKGSAQMLGVGDIAEAVHLFEGLVDDAMAMQPAEREPAIRIMFDLHDLLKQRLQDVSGKPSLDIKAVKARIAGLSSAPDESPEAESKTATHEVPDTPSAKKKPGNRGKGGRKRKPRVPSNLIAAVMGSLEGSLQPPATGGSAAVKAKQRGQKKKSKSEVMVDFRPDVAALSMDDVAADASSGNFLRVNRERISRLSNQIIELGSGRYMEAFPEQQLQTALQSFEALRQELAEIQGQDPGAAWRSNFERNLRHLQGFGDAMRAQQRRSTGMLDDLRDQVLGLLLRPVGSLFSAFPHAVREAARRDEKQVQLLLAGESVEMDQLTAERLSEALLHLINNAVAHGIETPELRLSTGKPEQGQITVMASPKGNDVEIVIIDDGSGMDIELISQRAVAKGMISDQEAADMDDSEVMELVFQTGFSTSVEVDELAGRGMGLSIVQDVLHELTGTIDIQSTIGKGTQFTLTVPVNLSVRQAKVFSAAGDRFGLLDNVVRQVLPFNAVSVKRGLGPYSHGYIDFEDHRVPLVDLTGADLKQSQDDARSVIIVEHLKGFLGLVVDRIEAEKEILVRDIDPYLKKYHPVGIMGCTITRDGSVLLLIDPDGLKEMWRTAPVPDLEAIDTSIGKGHRVMLVDDSTIALQIEKAMLERMGFAVDTAIGAADALEKIGLNHYNLLITDLGMPDMDGIGLSEQIRLLHAKRSLPVLMLAAIESEHEKERALAAGVDAYLVKRSLKGDMDGLISTITSLLNAHPVIDEPT